MDPETLKLLKAVITEGITSASWYVLLMAVVGAGLGAYLGPYLARRAEHKALRDDFCSVLKQLKAQTELTQSIKDKFAKDLQEFKSEQKQAQIVLTEQIRSLYAQDAFVRVLYSDALRQYCSEQASALRETYLLLFEPASSTQAGAEQMALEVRLESARQLVMHPLRKHLGWLDEKTIRKVTKVHNEIAEMKGKSQSEITKKKNDIFGETELARQYVKVDRIAHRLGLISHSLGSAEMGTRHGEDAGKEIA